MICVSIVCGFNFILYLFSFLTALELVGFVSLELLFCLIPLKKTYEK